MKFRRIFAMCLFTSMATSNLAWARHDPLTSAEIDQLRDVAQEPEPRLKLLAKFARARLTAVDQLRADPRFAAERGRRVHDLLEDFDGIVEEIDKNIDMYADRKADLRKPLKTIIEADSEFQLKLRSLKESASTPAAAAEANDYRFVLENAIETVNSSADNARQLLQEQNVSIKAEKEKGKKKK